MSKKPLAVTGATGFVGGRLLELAHELGRPLTCLTRRPQPEKAGVKWVQGDLHDKAALAQLCEGADAVIHIAGVINAPDREGFEKGNVEGTKNLLDAAKAQDVSRFVHVSSLAAREPSLSLYGASKARSETAVKTAGIDHVIVRPPAVYGPGDRETLELFKMAQRGLVMLPPKGRMSVVHADDLVRLLLTLADGHGRSGLLIEVDDNHAGAWTHEGFAKALGRAVGCKTMTLSMPKPVVRFGATLDRMFRGDKAKLTPDRAAYFCHPDWSVDPDKRPDPDLFTPAIATPDGLRDTARWYREKGWL
ncbi:NAD-dependent epimerase/dehydratase family protein [Sphingomicrobium sediminis]|uniref:NAD-dependent epimerase/dehydratase family protein n=1 Tax=Sphingomicrobium sediminis TaxID=2950949 RepID=A0A9X2EN94_9SPHN|nr:NAD-dependent epimerase/dehydratase family protein [Sphingomicrobium sediminis]MCM8558509.1 NAD-dependent epimerase/dehydratase family protein [Sphingomicrobium sediminis]